ncbi:MAG TPA: hypothetical protein VFF31_02900 [Blastocatellia bacterium]|nr:hypothetical protein [Blastocatellia bacterium]
MVDLAYNIPVRMIDEYRDSRVIVRSHSASEIVACLTKEPVKQLMYVQLLSLDCEVDQLIHWGESAPIDIVMQDPAEFPKLYRYSDLLENHPVRVSIPAAPGCYKAVKLAVSLNFGVKLLIGQPDHSLIAELARVLDLYLYRPNVAQPVEYFHSTFLSFYQGVPNALWLVQEDDPAVIRYITDDGEDTVSPRLEGIASRADCGSVLAGYQRALLAKESECESCEFWDNCGGYFKWPEKQYSCDGVKSLFRSIKAGAAELQSQLKSFEKSRGGTRQ